MMAQEFWRWHQPLEAGVQSALRSVGVAAVDEPDDESWDVTGAFSGEALIRRRARSG